MCKVARRRQTILGLGSHRRILLKMQCQAPTPFEFAISWYSNASADIRAPAGDNWINSCTDPRCEQMAAPALCPEARFQALQTAQGVPVHLKRLIDDRAAAVSRRNSRRHCACRKEQDGVGLRQRSFIFGPVHLVDDPASLIMVGEC